MKKFSVIATLITAILLIACSDPCTKYSKYMNEHENDEGCTDCFDKSVQLQNECNSYLADLSKKDKPSAILKCEDEHISYIDTCNELNENKSFIPDSEWRKKITNSDTARCINDIISTDIDFSQIDKIKKIVNYYEQQTAIDDYVEDHHYLDAMNIVHDLGMTIGIEKTLSKLDIQIKESEETLYKYSKGKYKCDLEHLLKYNVKVKPNGEPVTVRTEFTLFIVGPWMSFVKEKGSLEGKGNVFEAILKVIIFHANEEFIKGAGYYDVNVKDKNGETPLHHAVVKNGAKKGTGSNQILTLLKNNLEKEIRMEEGKSTGQFFSIKMALKPCLKRPAKCTNTITPLVEESYVKFNRGIIATILLLNNDEFDKDLFNAVRSALILPMTDPSERIRVASKSPAAREIMGANGLSDEDKTNIFGIWYLRQVPYAGEDIWKATPFTKHTWDEYLKMADLYLSTIGN